MSPVPRKIIKKTHLVRSELAEMFGMHESVTTSVNQFFRIHPCALICGSMPTLDLAEGMSMCSKSPPCQLVAIFNRRPSEIHHCLDIDRLAPPDTNKEDVLQMTEGERGNKGGVQEKPFSLSLSLSSGSQGHAGYEGMKRKERSLKDVSSRREEGGEMGKPLIHSHHL